MPVCLAQTIEQFTHVLSGITINIIPDKEPKYRTVRLNTGHLIFAWASAGSASDSYLVHVVGCSPSATPVQTQPGLHHFRHVESTAAYKNKTDVHISQCQAYLVLISLKSTLSRF